MGKGGIGVATLTDHGILLGSGTDAITPLGAATNGQIPIGSIGADPVLAGITGTTNQITVTNAAGSITLSTPQDIHTGASPTFAGLTTTGSSVLGLNSAVFQPTTDSTTFFQVLDADGGTPIFNIDSTNERVGIGTATPSGKLDVVGILNIIRSDQPTWIGTLDYETVTGLFVIGTNQNDDFAFQTGGVTRLFIEGDVSATQGYVGIGTSVPLGMLDIANTGAGAVLLRFQTERPWNFKQTDAGGSAKLDLHSEVTGKEFRISGSNDNNLVRVTTNATSANQIIALVSEGGKVGIGEAAPETLTEWTSTVPYLTLHNDTHEDTDGGRESRLNFKGEQSGGEETTLARIEAGHDGALDDQKGKIVFSTNDGADADTPTEVMRINSAGAVSTPNQATTLGAGVTTFGIKSNVMTITGDAGANTIATITGANSGTLLTLIFVDALVTITDTDAHTADTVDLLGTATNFTSADDTTLQLVYDGTSWYEVSRSVN